ncbi:MAG: iron ABC transporter permease [Proteobacteria bacterium]|nr:iron ABC transporter permease [Pseudomonadota bacterium]
MGRPGVWTVAGLAVAGLALLPILVVAGSVLLPAGDVWAHLSATVLPRYLWNTAGLVAGVGIVTVVIGVGSAWLVTMCAFPGRRVFEWALLLPLAMPAYAIAYTYGGMFDFAGPVQTSLREWFGWSRGDYWFPPVRSLGGAIIVLGVVLYPYVYMLTRAAFLEQSVCALEVGRSLGAGPWRGFFRVALPLARPAIVTGIALALMETLGDYGAVQYLAVDTFTTGIFRTWHGLGSLRAATQLAAILLAVVFAVLALERLSRGGKRYHHTSTRYRPLPRYPLRGWRAAAAVSACVLPVFLGFLLPVGRLAAWALATAPRMLDASFARLALNSVGLAAAASAIAVAVAVTLAWAIRLRPGRTMRIAARAASMGYAIPGAVVAVGVLVPLAWFDNTLDGLMRETFGVSTGLVLSGTVVALLFAYVVRFLSISLNAVESSLGRVTADMERSARTLGLGPGATLRRVHAPLMAGSLLTAGLLVFVDVMKELPATLVLRPFNFDTLAVRAFELASDERLADAANAALAIVLVGLIPVILLSRAIARSRPGGQ